MATEVSVLGLRVSPQGFTETNSNLIDFRKRAQEAADAAEELQRKSKNTGDAAKKVGEGAEKGAKGVDKLDKEMGKATGAAHNMAQNLGRLMGVLASFTGALVVGKLADSWSDMQSRVGAAIKDMGAAPAVMQQIVALSNATYSSLSQTVDTFAGNVGALREMGKSIDDTVKYTEALNHALVITATKGERAEAVQIALGKAMDVGKLGAEGLETILANGGRVAEALAKELGTTVGGLRGMASQGKITGDVIANALINNLETLRKEAAEMPATMADGLTRITTGFTYLVGSMDKATGASASVASIMLTIGDGLNAIAEWAANNPDTVAAIFRGILSAVVAVSAVYIGSFIPALAVATIGLATQAGAFILLNGGIWGAVAALVAMKGALMATGIGALIVVLGVAVYKFIELAQKVGGFGKALGLVADVGVEALTRIWTAGLGLWEGLKGVALGIQGAFLRAFQAIGTAWDSVANGIAGTWNLIAGTGAGKSMGLTEMGQSNVGGAIGGLADEKILQSGEAFRRAGGHFRDVIKPMESVKALMQALEEGAAATGNTVINLGDNTDNTGDKLKNLGNGAAGAAEKVGELDKVMKSLREELELLQKTQGMSELDKAIFGKQQEAGVSGGSVAGQAIEDAMRTIDALKKVEDAGKKGADAVAGIFTSMMDGSKKLKGAVADLLMEMAKVQMRNAVLGVMGGGGLLGKAAGWIGGMLTPNADGGVYNSPGLSAYSGSVVSSPTVFPFAKGAGLMGEAGPEAILPLKRGANGKLGVEAGTGGGQSVDVRVSVGVDEDGNINVRQIAQQEAAGAVSTYDRQHLRSRVQQINSKTRRNG